MVIGEMFFFIFLILSFMLCKPLCSWCSQKLLSPSKVFQIKSCCHSFETCNFQFLASMSLFPHASPWLTIDQPHENLIRNLVNSTFPEHMLHVVLGMIDYNYFDPHNDNRFLKSFHLVFATPLQFEPSQG